MPQIQIEQSGGQCPVEILGTINRNPFYFRSRGNSWSLIISRPETDPIDVRVSKDKAQDPNCLLWVWDYYGEPSDIYEAGYLSLEEADQLIEQIAQKFEAGLRGSHKFKEDPVKDGLHILCVQKYDQLHFGSDFRNLEKLFQEHLKKYGPEVAEKIESQKAQHLQKLEDWVKEVRKK